MGRRVRRGGRGQAPDAGASVGEAARLSLRLQLAQLAQSEAAELVLPSSLSLAERAYVHQSAVSLGLCTKSRGSGAKRFVTVFKRSESTLVQRDAALTLDRAMRHSISELIDAYPITGKEKEDLNSCERERIGHLSSACPCPGAVGSSAPQVPCQASQCSQEMLAFRRTLPVYNHREQILSAIDSSQVTVVVGETGSGKTTQIPQLILDLCQKEKKKCRLVCTQPRRISAVSVAERVAYERNEKIGCSVGYQIRLESRTSAKTVLTYCTNGVLLRALMGGGSALSSVTHVIVDEVHERDKFADFLLISLKDALAKHKDLKVILMSATIDAALFSRYFNNCPVTVVPGKMFEVQKLHLEDILPLIRYKTEAMRKIEKSWEKTAGPRDRRPQGEPQTSLNPAESRTPREQPLEPSLQSDVDEFLDDCYDSGSADSFGQILYAYVSEDVPVDSAHSRTGTTGLMAAARHGYVDTVQDLIKMGADVDFADKNGKTAYHYALSRGHSECADLLRDSTAEAAPTATPESDEREFLLSCYQRSVSEDTVDYNLVLHVIKYIHVTQPKGSILVFLTGYSDIVELRDVIQNCSELRHGSYQLFTLHSKMQTGDQKKIFQRSPTLRKIILSTNIAETSVTIDDVVYVIDGGRVKQLYYETSSEASTLQSCWISKACAAQRAGRAGRVQPGRAFMLYSKRRYESFDEQTSAEILRVPLHELCLHSKLLAPSNAPIADYLSRAMEPPPFVAVKNSVALLKTIGALTPTEDLTEIGQHLLGLTIEPKLGKMILYACVLKCLDPVLTVACSLAAKEPFQLNRDKDDANNNRDARREFSGDSLSDHMCLLRAFQAWQVSRINKTERAFCKRKCISRAAMETIFGYRAQLLAQLRALGFVKARGAGDVKDVNQNSEKWYVVKAALVGGSYPSIARIDREENTLRSNREAKLAFHPASALHVGRGRAGLTLSTKKIPSDWIAYDETVRVGRARFIRCNTAVTALTVALLAGPLRLGPAAVKMNLPGLSDDSDSDQEEGNQPGVETGCLSLDDWISFTALTHDVLSVYVLRQKFSALLIRKMSHPSRTSGQMDDKILSAVAYVLGLEERRVGMIQQTGVSSRPKATPTDTQGGETSYNNYDPRANQNPFQQPTLTNMYNHKNNHYFKQGKQQQGSTYQNFVPGKAPSSPQCGNILLANIEKYTNSDNAAAANSTRYFVLKAVDTSTVENSQTTGTWTFANTTLKKLTEITEAGSKVILFFSIGEVVSRFFGFAEFTNAPSDGEENVYKIKWLSSQVIPHYLTRNLLNSLNENRRVFSSADGQEISRENGKALMALLDQNSKKPRNNGRPIQKQTI